jgi:hypothetical protein
MVGESKIIQVSSEFHTNLDVAMHFLPSYHRIPSSGMFMWALVSRMGLEVGAGVVWWVASRNIRRFEYFAGVKNIKQNMVLNTISHPHIAATRRHWCIKEIRGGWKWWKCDVTDAAHAAARPSWCRRDREKWWVRKSEKRERGGHEQSRIFITLGTNFLTLETCSLTSHPGIYIEHSCSSDNCIPTAIISSTSPKF